MAIMRVGPEYESLAVGTPVQTKFHVRIEGIAQTKAEAGRNGWIVALQGV